MDNEIIIKFVHTPYQAVIILYFISLILCLSVKLTFLRIQPQAFYLMVGVCLTQTPSELP